MENICSSQTPQTSRTLQLFQNFKFPEEIIASIGIFLTATDFVNIYNSQIEKIIFKQLSLFVRKLSLTTELTKINDSVFFNFSNLRELKIDGKYDLRQLVYYANRNLEVLRLSNMDNDVLEYISPDLHIKELSLEGCRVNNDTFMHIFINLSKLEILNLKGRGMYDMYTCRNLVNGEGLEYISRLPNIVKLNLYMSKISNSGLTFLINLKNLKSLSLEACWNITDEGILNISFFSLEELNVRNTKVTDLGFNIIANSFNNLTKLTANSLITNQGLQYISKLSKLIKLKLYSCQKITNEGLFHIKKLINIERLNIGECYNINDDSLQIISNLPELKKLNIRSTNITNNGLEYLLTLLKLEILNLESTDIDDDGILSLVKLSNIKIIRLALCDKLTQIGRDRLYTLNNVYAYVTFYKD